MISQYKISEAEFMASFSAKEIQRLRAWWWHRQWLDGHRVSSSPVDVLAKCGWARSVGGCGPYITLFSRARISREAADRSVETLEIHELPAARGCTYVVPASDYPLALCLAREFGSGDMRTAEKLGVTRKEVDTLRQAVLGALKKGPLAPDDIREATGKAVRSLGPEGQKKGLSSTLPLALGELQREGAIRRIPTNGRLDNQRYQYALWNLKPLSPSKVEWEAALVDVARRFFAWIAPAALSDFQTFAGISAKTAKAATESLKLEAMWEGSDLCLPAALRDEFESFKAPKESSCQLLTNLDSLLLLRRDLSIFLEPADLAHPLLAAQVSCTDSSITELPSPAIVENGRVVGLWEYDPASESIAYFAFKKADAPMKKAVAEAEEYVRTQLGDARTFSLDSPKSRIPRMEALRKASA